MKKQNYNWRLLKKLGFEFDSRYSYSTLYFKEDYDFNHFEHLEIFKDHGKFYSAQSIRYVLSTGRAALRQEGEMVEIFK